MPRLLSRGWGHCRDTVCGGETRKKCRRRWLMMDNIWGPLSVAGMAGTNVQVSPMRCRRSARYLDFRRNLTSLGRTGLWLALAADGKRIQQSPITAPSPRLPPTGTQKDVKICRGPCICVALRQVILKLLAPLTGQFLVPHPSFHSTMASIGGLEWPSLGGPGGEKVWAAALRSRTSELPRHSQS